MIGPVARGLKKIHRPDEYHGIIFLCRCAKTKKSMYDFFLPIEERLLSMASQDIGKGNNKRAIMLISKIDHLKKINRTAKKISDKGAIAAKRASTNGIDAIDAIRYCRFAYIMDAIHSKYKR